MSGWMSIEDTVPSDLLRAFDESRDRDDVPVDSFAAESIGSTSHDHNEDAWGHRGGNTFAVADGMGGRQGGDLAASTAVAVVLDELDRDAPVDWEQTMARTNLAVMEAARRWGLGKIGTTLAVVRCRAGRVTVAHAGDSRIYRLRNGQISVLTTDHTVRGELEAAGVRPSTVAATPSQLAGLTCFLGDHDSWRRFSVCNLAWSPGDRLVVSTDGVHGVLHPSMWSAAAQAGSCAEMAMRLVSEAQTAGTRDDATALVLELAPDDSKSW